MLSDTSINLPELPKKLNKRESKVTPIVLKWFRNSNLKSCAIEIKATNKDKIYEKALQPHQRLALLSASQGVGLVHKIADNKTRLPFDAFMLRSANAYVVACFTKHGICLVIPIQEWDGASYTDDALYKIDI